MLYARSVSDSRCAALIRSAAYAVCGYVWRTSTTSVMRPRRVNPALVLGKRSIQHLQAFQQRRPGATEEFVPIQELHRGPVRLLCMCLRLGTGPGLDKAAALRHDQIRIRRLNLVPTHRERRFARSAQNTFGTQPLDQARHPVSAVAGGVGLPVRVPRCDRRVADVTQTAP